MTGVVAIIPHFHVERVPNLQPIVDSLITEKVSDVIVWNNDAPLGPLYDAHVIEAGRNWGCQARFQAVKHVNRDLLGDPSHILFSDNDVIAARGSLQRLLDESIHHPDAIISGKWGHRVYHGDTVCISFGRYELIPYPLVKQLLDTWAYDPELVFEDMWLCIRARQLGISVRKVRIKLTDLERGVGFRFTPAMQQAAVVFRQLMERAL